MPVELQAVEEVKWYPLHEAARLIPGPSGNPMHPATLRQWCRDKVIPCRKIGRGYFIQGREIQKKLNGEG